MERGRPRGRKGGVSKKFREDWKTRLKP